MILPHLRFGAFAHAKTGAIICRECKICGYVFYYRLLFARKDLRDFASMTRFA